MHYPQLVDFASLLTLSLVIITIHTVQNRKEARPQPMKLREDFIVAQSLMIKNEVSRVEKRDEEITLILEL